MPRSILVPLCAGAVLLSTGCGGGSNPARLSETAFQSRANNICKDLTRRQQPDLTTNSKAAIDRNLGRIDSALSQLKGLQPPARDESRYRQLLASFHRSVDFVRAHEATLISLTDQMRSHPSDPHLTAQYRTLVRPFVLEIRLASTDADALGLGACAKGFTG